MKNFQRNLFILLAVALCGTCAYQWYLQGNQMLMIQKQNQTIFEQSSAIQGLTNSLKLRDDQIAQLSSRVSALKRTIMTNDQQLLEQKREIARLQSSEDLLTNEVSQYKVVVDQMTAKLKEAYADENKLADQRNEFVKKLNDQIRAQNDLTKKYNDLVERFNQLQAAPPAK